MYDQDTRTFQELESLNKGVDVVTPIILKYLSNTPNLLYYKRYTFPNSMSETCIFQEIFLI